MISILHLSKKYLESELQSALYIACEQFKPLPGAISIYGCINFYIHMWIGLKEGLVQSSEKYKKKHEKQIGA